MESKVFSIEDKELRTLTLNDAVFAIQPSEGSIWHAIRNELANKRQGTASSKTRGNVKGSGKKPWRQKGTGRARAGDRKSPLWRGGGTVFGPQPIDYSYKLPKKIKRLAFRSILSLKAQDKENFKIVENFTVESGKTRDLSAILKNFSLDKGRTVIVLGGEDPSIRRAGNNIPNLFFLSYNRLGAHELFYGKNILMLEDAVVKLNEFYGAGHGSQ